MDNKEDIKSEFDPSKFFNSYDITERVETLFGTDKELNRKILNSGFKFNDLNKSFEAIYILDTEKNITLDLTLTTSYDRDTRIFKLRISHTETNYHEDIEDYDLKSLLFYFHLSYKNRCVVPTLLIIQDNFKKLMENKASQGKLVETNMRIKHNDYGTLESMTNTHIIFKKYISDSEYTTMVNNYKNRYHMSSNNLSPNDFKKNHLKNLYEAITTFRINELSSYELSELISIQKKSLTTLIDRKTFKEYVENDKASISSSPELETEIETEIEP